MDRPSVIRTIVLFIALINQFLTACGLYEIPGTTEDQTFVVSTAFTIVTSVIGWFKNNYILPKGMKQKEILKKNNLH